jgi:outer membrane usher protein
MRMKGSVAGLFLYCVLVSAPAWASLKIRAVRVDMEPDSTRLVVESDRPIKARIRSAGKALLLLDLDGIKDAHALGGLVAAIGRNNPLVVGARIEGRAGGERLFLPLRDRVHARLFHIRAGEGFGDRLVLDLLRSDGHEPAPPTQPPGMAITGSAPGSETADQKARIYKTRIGSTPDCTRLVLESAQRITAQTVPTLSPGLITINLERVADSAALQRLPARIPSNPFLSAIGIRQQSSSVQLDLHTRAKVHPRIFVLPPGEEHGYRLVIDLLHREAGEPALKPAPSAFTASQPLLAANSSSAGGSAAKLEETWISVEFNGTDRGTSLLYQTDGGDMFIDAADLQAWHLRAPCSEHIKKDDHTLCRISGEKGLSLKLDALEGVLTIHAAPLLLNTNNLVGISSSRYPPTPSATGAYLNYDIYAGENGHDHAESAMLEAGMFGRWGSGTTTMLTHRTQEQTATVRLDTTWTFDDPDRMASMRIGDTITGTSDWGRAVRIGGIQWATNFSTRPDLVTFPLPALAGVAVAPSTLDYYVNDTLRFRQNVPEGPFAIQELPVVTGAGDLSLVVRDALGREQVITQPFYASSSILTPGLRDYSYEIGFERRNYGLSSNDYGSPVLVGTERRGLSNHLTGEVHAEVLKGQQTLGLSGSFLLGDAGTMTFSAAGSHASGKGTGNLLGMGFEHKSRFLNVGLRTQFTSSTFTELGYDDVDRPPRQVTQAYTTLASSKLGSLGLTYTYQDFRDRADLRTIGANYGLSLGRIGYLGLSAMRFLDSSEDTLVFLTFTTPLGPSNSLGIQSQFQGGAAHGTVQLQHNLPAGNGVGYRLQEGLTASDPKSAELTLQNNVGTYMFGVANTQGLQQYQASVRGGLALMNGDLYPSRHLDDSFAVVHVPGFSNVRVYDDNQLVGVTNAEGNALVPRLRPYQRNPIRIEQADLPLDANIANLQMDAVPYDRSGISLTFPVSRSLNALVVIQLADGSRPPPGATVMVDDRPGIYTVGYDGEAYLTDLKPTNVLHLQWPGSTCDIRLDVPGNASPISRFGPLICREVPHK